MKKDNSNSLKLEALEHIRDLSKLEQIESKFTYQNLVVDELLNSVRTLETISLDLENGVNSKDYTTRKAYDLSLRSIHQRLSPFSGVSLYTNEDEWDDFIDQLNTFWASMLDNLHKGILALYEFFYSFYSALDKMYAHLNDLSKRAEKVFASSGKDTTGIKIKPPNLHSFVLNGKLSKENLFNGLETLEKGVLYTSLGYQTVLADYYPKLVDEIKKFNSNPTRTQTKQFEYLINELNQTLDTYSGFAEWIGVLLPGDYRIERVVINQQLNDEKLTQLINIKHDPSIGAPSEDESIEILSVDELIDLINRAKKILNDLSSLKETIEASVHTSNQLIETCNQTVNNIEHFSTYEYNQDYYADIRQKARYFSSNGVLLAKDNPARYSVKIFKWAFNYVRSLSFLVHIMLNEHADDKELSEDVNPFYLNYASNKPDGDRVSSNQIQEDKRRLNNIRKVESQRPMRWVM